MLPEELFRTHPRFASSFAGGLVICGQLEAAERWLQIAEEGFKQDPGAYGGEQTNRATRHIAAFLNASHHLAQLRILHGRLGEARTIYQQALDFVAEQDYRVLVGIERAGLGDLYREWNDLQRAVALTDDGVELAEAGGDIFFLRDAYIARGRSAAPQGDWHIARSKSPVAAYAYRLYTLAETSAVSGNGSPEANALLGERELEILRLVSDGVI